MKIKNPKRKINKKNPENPEKNNNKYKIKIKS